MFSIDDLEEIEKIQTAARIALKNKLKQMTVEDIEAETEEIPEEAIEEVKVEDDSDTVQEQTIINNNEEG